MLDLRNTLCCPAFLGFMQMLFAMILVMPSEAAFANLKNTAKRMVVG